MGGVEDELGRAVVALELDDGRVRVVPFEVEDVPDIGATPAVDRLVVVADDGQVAMLRGEGPDPEVLRSVRVLVFVDVEVAPAILVPSKDVWCLVEQPDGLEQEVVEVEGADLLQALDVANGETGNHLFVVIDGVVAEELRVEHLVLRPADRAEDGARPELAGERHVLLAEDRLHQSLLVVRVVDDEPTADPDRLAVAPEDTGTERMERARLDVAARLADERDDPLAQLPGGAVGERHREDLPRLDPADADEIGDPVGQYAGLARPGPGEDQQWPVGRRDGPCLLRVQGPDDLFGAAGSTGGSGRLLLGLASPALVRAELRGLLPGEWRIVQPVGFDEASRRRLGSVGEGGPERIRGIVGSGVDGSSTGRWAHPLIVGRAPSLGIAGSSPYDEEAPRRRCVAGLSGLRRERLRSDLVGRRGGDADRSVVL